MFLSCASLHSRPATTVMPAINDPVAFRERLPDGCPPDEAEKLSDVRVVFRLVRTDPPTEEDFRSERAELPNNRFGASECMARGLSVFSNQNAARRLLRARRHRGKLICQITLDQSAGYILKTFGRSHFTWWPFADFDILGHCQVLDQ